MYSREVDKSLSSSRSCFSRSLIILSLPFLPVLVPFHLSGTFHKKLSQRRRRYLNLSYKSIYKSPRIIIIIITLEHRHRHPPRQSSPFTTASSLILTDLYPRTKAGNTRALFLVESLPFALLGAC